MTPANLEQLLATLPAWLNQNLPLDPKKPVSAEDIAHLALTVEEFATIPGVAERCPWKGVTYKQFADIELWECRYVLPAIADHAGLRGRIAWKLTSGTAAIFRNRP